MRALNPYPCGAHSWQTEMWRTCRCSRERRGHVILNDNFTALLQVSETGYGLRVDSEEVRAKTESSSEMKLPLVR